MRPQQPTFGRPHRTVCLRQTGTLAPASHGVDGTPAKRTCLDPALSTDGRHVTFDSDDGTLVAGDTDGTDNIFVTDLGS